MSFSPCYEIPAACHRVLGWFLEGGELLGLSHACEYDFRPFSFCYFFSISVNSTVGTHSDLVLTYSPEGRKLVSPFPKIWCPLLGKIYSLENNEKEILLLALMAVSVVVPCLLLLTIFGVVKLSREVATLKMVVAMSYAQR